MGKANPQAEQTEESPQGTPQSEDTKEGKVTAERKPRTKKKSSKVKTETADGDEEQPTETAPPVDSSTPSKKRKDESEKSSKKREGKSKKHKNKAETGSSEVPESENQADSVEQPASSVPDDGNAQPETTDSVSPTNTNATNASSSTPGSQTSLSGTLKDTGEIVFVDDLDAMYRCISCGQPLRVPILFEDCGHRCCSGCLSNVLHTSRCPSDNTHLKQDHIKMDKEFQLQMDNLAVRCTYCASGCPWTGKLAQLGSHLSHCGHRTIVCPNGCGVEFEHRFVGQHLNEDCPKRSMKCKFCDAAIMAANELKHIGICPKFPVTCPNGCKVHEIPRSELTEHLTTKCVRQELPCPYAPHGCKVRGKKKKLEAHVTESTLEHLNMINTSMQQMSLLLEAQTKSFSELKLVLTQQAKRITGLERCFGAAFTWKIDNYTEKLNLAKSGKQTTIFSPAFYSYRCGYRMAMSVCLFGSGEARGKFMSLFVCLCRGDHDALLPWPFTHQLTFTMLDQHPDVTMRKAIDYTIKPNPKAEQNMFLGRPTNERNACFGAPRFVKLETLKTSDYIVDDSLFLKLSINLDDIAPA